VKPKKHQKAVSVSHFGTAHGPEQVTPQQPYAGSKSYRLMRQSHVFTQNSRQHRPARTVSHTTDQPLLKTV